jgi:kynurenine aminotransferase
MIMINNPQNVPGKIWSRDELESIATVAKKHDLLVISDEVYEGMVYDDNVLTRMSTLPGNQNGGKVFVSIGKVCGNAH